MIKKICIIAFVCAVMSVRAQDKPKKEKTPAETIAELKAQLVAFEQVQLYEKYEKEISSYKPSKKLKSKVLLLKIKTKKYNFPKSEKRNFAISAIVRLFQSYIDNNVAKSRQRAIAKSLHSYLKKKQVMTDQALNILIKDTGAYLTHKKRISELHPAFPFLLQGASFAHAQILASKPTAGKTQAIEVMAKGGGDLFASLVFQRANKGHWTLTAKDKLILSALEKGKSETEARQLAHKKEAVSQHCENYTGKTITCDGRLFVLAKEKASKKREISSK